jgi:mono/diheme cytochrome c family protein
MRSIVETLLVGAATALLAAPAARGEVDKKIERTWKAKCAACHGADGKADTEQGRQMGVADYTQASWQKGRSDAQLKQAILEGVHQDKGGRKQEMDGYKDKLSPEQVDGLVAYVRALGK